MASVIAENDVSVKDILDMYVDYLPNPLHLNNKAIHWRRKWTALEVSSRPYKISRRLKNVTKKRI